MISRWHLGMIALSLALAPLELFIQPAQGQSAAGDPFVAVATKVIQPVLLQRSGADQRSPLKPNDRLYPGDRLISGNGGQASIIYADNAVEIKLEANTELIFQGQRNPNNILKRLWVQIGNLWTNVVRGDMEVVTPTCVASVKGTQWWTAVDITAQTLVIVLEGNVEVKNTISGNVAVVSAGNTATSTMSGSLQVAPTEGSQIPGSAAPEQGSLDIEYEDESGQTKTLHIEFAE